MKKLSSAQRYGLLLTWVVVATAVGIYITNLLTKNRDQTILAPLADIERCGPTAINNEDERRLLTDWTDQADKLPADAKAALARNVKALPDGATRALKARKFRFALDKSDSKYTCTRYEKSPGKGQQPARALGTAANCLNITGNDSATLVMSAPQWMMPDGQPRGMSYGDLIDLNLLPTTFWTLFNGLYETRDAFDQTKPSIKNISSQIKRYVVEAYKFSPEEQEFYYKEYGGAGTTTPAFINRTLVLTASGLYCSKESYARLNNSQPEATKRFMGIYGCALGKPWHMLADDFASLCPSVALNK